MNNLDLSFENLINIGVKAKFIELLAIVTIIRFKVFDAKKMSKLLLTPYKFNI